MVLHAPLGTNVDVNRGCKCLWKKKTTTTGDQRMCRNVGSAFLEDIFYMLDNFRLGLFYLLSFSWINVRDMFHKSYVI